MSYVGGGHVHAGSSKPRVPAFDSVTTHPKPGVDVGRIIGPSAIPLVHHGFSLSVHVSHVKSLVKYQTQFRSLLERSLPGMRIEYNKAQAPTLASLTTIAHLVPCAISTAVLSVSTAGTLVEKVQGGRLIMDYEDFPSVEQLEAFFTEEAMPANLAKSTRVDYDRKWRAWITFAVAHGRVSSAFPADPGLLRAFVTHMLLCQYTPGTVAQFLACIVTRHRQFGARAVFGWGEMSKWLGGIRKTLGVRQREKFRLRLHHLHAFSRFSPVSLQEVRDDAMCFVGTVGARRQSELIALDVCDWRCDFERDGLGRSFGASLYIKRQKNDPTMAGMWVRYAYGASVEACVINKVEHWLQVSGLRAHPQCPKWRDARLRSESCELCGRLFRSMSGPNHLARDRQQLSKKSVGDALNRMLTRASFDTAGFASKSLRKGGLSTAKRAGLPSALRKLQSGHKSAAHKVYESGSDTDEELIPEVSRIEPKMGWSLRDLYRFSTCFHY